MHIRKEPYILSCYGVLLFLILREVVRLDSGVHDIFGAYAEGISRNEVGLGCF